MAASDSPAEISTKMVSMFLKALQDEGWRVELSNGSKIRINGVQDGELFFAIRCKVFKIEEKPSPSVPHKPESPP